jgi:hypothetical protein
MQDKGQRKQSKQYYAQYREKNRLKIRRKQREWYLQNKDKAKAVVGAE